MGGQRENEGDRVMVELSVIIVSYNTRDLLRELLSSLGKYLPPSLTHEIIVVDNASHDGSAEMVSAEYSGVKLIASGENLGFAKANNRALNEAAGTVLLFLNPDTLLVADHEFGLILRRFAEEREVGIIGGRVFDRALRQVSSYGHDPTPFTLAFHFSLPGKIAARLIPSLRIYRLANYDRRSYEVGKNVDHVNGCCFFVRREMVDRIGMLDERFFIYLEETDICKRAREARWRVIYLPLRTVVHYGQESARQHRTQMSEQFLKSLRIFYEKHYPGKVKQLEWILRMKIIKPKIKDP